MTKVSNFMLSFGGRIQSWSQACRPGSQRSTQYPLTLFLLACGALPSQRCQLYEQEVQTTSELRTRVAHAEHVANEAMELKRKVRHGVC